MINLNLIPPEKKTKLKEEKVIFLLKTIAFTLVIFFGLFLGLLYGTRILLDQRLTKINNEISSLESTTANGNQSTFSSLIKEINEKIVIIKNIQSNYIKWSAYLAEFSPLIPVNISLNEITINQETCKIQIRGIASFRDDFLILKSNLENSLILDSIESPISNLIKQENINFDLSATMVLEEYHL